MKASETQIGGDHYKDMPIQPAEFCQKNGLGYCESNVIKYVSRHRHKHGRQDIEKAIHYLQMLIEMEYPEEQAIPEHEGLKKRLYDIEPPALKTKHDAEPIIRDIFSRRDAFNTAVLRNTRESEAAILWHNKILTTTTGKYLVHREGDWCCFFLEDKEEEPVQQS